MAYAATASSIVVRAVAQPVLGLIGVKSWGRMIDGWGRRPVLFLATVLMTLSLVPWLLVTRHTPAPAWLLDAGNWVFRHAGGLFGRPDWFVLTSDMPVAAYLAAILEESVRAPLEPAHCAACCRYIVPVAGAVP